MALRRAFELAREAGDADHPLRARLEVAELDVPAAQLVAEDDREVRPVARRRLELPAELALAELGAAGALSRAGPWRFVAA